MVQAFLGAPHLSLRPQVDIEVSTWVYKYISTWVPRKYLGCTQWVHKSKGKKKISQVQKFVVQAFLAGRHLSQAGQVEASRGAEHLPHALMDAQTSHYPHTWASPTPTSPSSLSSSSSTVVIMVKDFFIVITIFIIMIKIMNGHDHNLDQHDHSH